MSRTQYISFFSIYPSFHYNLDLHTKHKSIVLTFFPFICLHLTQIQTHLSYNKNIIFNKISSLHEFFWKKNVCECVLSLMKIQIISLLKHWEIHSKVYIFCSAELSTSPFLSACEILALYNFKSQKKIVSAEMSNEIDKYQKRKSVLKSINRHHHLGVPLLLQPVVLVHTVQPSLGPS